VTVTRADARPRPLLFAAFVAVLAGIVPVGVAQLGGAATRRQATTSPSTVLLVGDSLMKQAADGIRAALPGTDVIDAGSPGSGLLNGPVDWSARAAALVAKYHPDVVVVSFVGNYDQSEGTLVVDSPAYYSAWADAAQRLTTSLRDAGARVDWVEQPPLRDPNFYGAAATRTDVLLSQYLQLATEPGVGIVGALDAVATADGTFTTEHDVCGADVTLRIADGVHFTSTGGDWWGANLGRAIGQREGLATREPCSVMAELHPHLG
jgi:hypothetical protein